MPIRLNLLAEAQAAAEMRRRDPVKRALWVSGLLITLVLLWCGYLQLRAMMAGSEVGRIELQVLTHTNQYQQVISDQQKSSDIQQKLTALQEMATNRFLNGNLLQALQRTTVDDVQLVRLRVDQAYAYVEGTKPRTNEDRVIPGTPARSTEKLMITLDGSDTSPRFDQYPRFQDLLAANSYLKSILVKTNAVTLRSGSLSSPQVALSGKLAVSFSLECRTPDKTR
jgi:hypothetical protein